MMFKNPEHTCIIINKETQHDTCIALIKDNKLECILETERVTKHKHAEFDQPENELIPYIINKYNLSKDIPVYDETVLARYKYSKHHELHALSSFLSSGYDKACILVIDGAGDLNDSITLYYGEGENLTEIKKYYAEGSLGMMYEAASSLLYKTPFSEGKLMGLSCCNEPNKDIISPIEYDEDGNLKLNYILNEINDSSSSIKTYIRSKFAYLFNDSEVLNNDVYKAKIAATVQNWFTEQVINLVKYLKKLYPNVDNLCLAGGCFLNCETNGIIDQLDIFKNIYCIPAPADNGLLLGKVQQILPEPTKIESPYFGPKQYKTFEQLKEIFWINGEDSTIDNIDNFVEYDVNWVIDKLKQNKVIIWFDGESEFGPRALGHRSFLANPSTNKMFWDLSVGIKQRESYRPLAPIVIDKLYTKIFEDKHPNNLTTFMLKTVRIKDEWIDKLPAITHINKTARPQMLKEEVNPALYKLLDEFYKETGIPCLINTSLNLKNQPLLETYSDLITLIRDLKVSGNKTSVVINHSLCFDIN